MIKRIIHDVLSKRGLKLQEIKKTDFNEAVYHDVYPSESIEQKRFYNVGAGGFWHPYWTNVDYQSDWYEVNKEQTSTGIHYDLFSLEPIPVDDSVAEVVYTSHTIEHIKNNHAQHFFNESFRMLKNGGILRITCPDIDLHYRAFHENDRHFFYWKDWYVKESDYSRVALNAPLDSASTEQLFLHALSTVTSELHTDGIDNRITDEQVRNIFKENEYEEALDFCCDKCPLELQKKYPGNHTNWWNREKVTRMLNQAGFEKVKISGYGQSEAAIMRNTDLFDSTHPRISLYMEAIK